MRVLNSRFLQSISLSFTGVSSSFVKSLQVACAHKPQTYRLTPVCSCLNIKLARRESNVFSKPQSKQRNLYISMALTIQENKRAMELSPRNDSNCTNYKPWAKKATAYDCLCCFHECILCKGGKHVLHPTIHTESNLFGLFDWSLIKIEFKKKVSFF